MEQIVINTCFGGFGLSELALKWLKEHGVKTEPYYDIERNDPLLVKCVFELGSKANDWASDLKVVNIPKGIKWHIDEYDGLEEVHEDHRVWR